MKLKVKQIPIGTGDIRVAVMNAKDATQRDLYSEDRILIKKGKKKVIATLDIYDEELRSEDSKEKGVFVVPLGRVGLFIETQKDLGIKDSEVVDVCVENKPRAVSLIRKKLRGEKLTNAEIKEIVDAIADGKLMDIEIAYFVAGLYVHELDINETAALTKAMINTGEVLKFNKKVIVDKHCIGGVAGNRTTMMVVPIIAASGLTIPKTSSRSITSAAGTADTVEVLSNVSFPIKKMKSIVNKTNGCLVWGGAVNLAPADDKIIRAEHPISLDPTCQLLASILAKKLSVSANHILIDIPTGKGSKIPDRKDGLKLKKKFEILAKKLGVKLIVLLTDGSQPIGNGIGPSLEARDVIWTLQDDKRGSLLLKEKSIKLAGAIFELAGKCKKGKGKKLAREILESGKAEKKFWEIIKAQEGKKVKAEKIRLAKHFYTVKTNRPGKVLHVDNNLINKFARFAGAPHDKEAGVYLHVHKDDHVKVGDKLFTIYSDTKDRLTYSRSVCDKLRAIKISK
jgi:AMP phosphorylase